MKTNYLKKTEEIDGKAYDAAVNAGHFCFGIQQSIANPAKLLPQIIAPIAGIATFKIIEHIVKQSAYWSGLMESTILGNTVKISCIVLSFLLWILTILTIGTLSAREDERSLRKFMKAGKSNHRDSILVSRKTGEFGVIVRRIWTTYTTSDFEKDKRRVEEALKGHFVKDGIIYRGRYRGLVVIELWMKPGILPEDHGDIYDDDLE